MSRRQLCMCLVCNEAAGGWRASGLRVQCGHLAPFTPFTSFPATCPLPAAHEILQSNQFGITLYSGDPTGSLFEDVTVRVNFDVSGE